ncbi:hypothetical protein FHT87_004010 [Rhizobium sp. BK316]|uniref:hypothetical protein n=1 Tax=Rhizobium sp. BK316 TaxID=2587053 RepID=UPI001607100D|nr:hypothetical protein [Rhizobium sp. BK316]MBB3410078.1 hypothetical protein [Rhizobium sp. BK316]
MLQPTVKFSAANIAAFKKALRKQHDMLRSGHVDEALASAFGFKSHAAMLHILNQLGGSTRVVIQIDPCLLIVRLEEFGYHGLSLDAVRRLAWDLPFPDAWRSDETEGAIRGRFLPVAANSR